jgi:hypothetical protein
MIGVGENKGHLRMALCFVERVEQMDESFAICH